MPNPFHTASTLGRLPAPSLIRRDIPTHAAGVRFYQFVLPAHHGLQQRWVVELSAVFTHRRPITRHFASELHARDWLADLLGTPRA